MSKPSFEPAVEEARRSGRRGCCRSESMSTTASASAAIRPAVSATSLPKLRLSRSSRMSNASRPPRPGRSALAPPSWLPSSTKMASMESRRAGRLLAREGVERLDQQRAAFPLSSRKGTHRLTRAAAGSARRRRRRRCGMSRVIPDRGRRRNEARRECPTPAACRSCVTYIVQHGSPDRPASTRQSVAARRGWRGSCASSGGMCGPFARGARWTSKLQDAVFQGVLVGRLRGGLRPRSIRRRLSTWQLCHSA